MSANPRLDLDGLAPQQCEGQICALVAWDNQIAADLLLDKFPNVKSVYPSAVVLRSLGAELMIKAALIELGVPNRSSHDLLALFNLLPEGSKTRSEMEFKRATDLDLTLFLTKQRRAFVEWRYLHEQRNLQVTPEDLRKAFIAIFSGVSPECPGVARVNPSPGGE